MGELSLVHLARAFIMNPEVMVLQRPLRNYNEARSRRVLEVMKFHVRERGLALPENQRPHRRPRTMFFSAENSFQAAAADIIWHVTPIGVSHTPAMVVQKSMAELDPQVFSTGN